MRFRIGNGYDVHQMEENREFWLGGIRIPHTHGATGHSDADVLIHAICDSLLGAANLNDIGFHFSNKDPQYKNIDSKILLKRTLEIIRKEGYEVGNIDVMLLLEAPKISRFIPEMKKVLSGVMAIREKDLSIKATTSETLGFVGRKEGLAAYAVSLIYEIDATKDSDFKGI